MSSIIDLDSFYRDRDDNPNPCDYVINAKMTDTWFSSAREVRAMPSNALQRPLEFVSTVRLETLILPWNADLVGMPKIYVNFHSKAYNDRFLINGINGVHSECNFICLLEKTQLDGAGDPVWVHYRCPIEQTMRFRRNDTYFFRITSRSGEIIPFFIDDLTAPIDPALQTMATFTITPFIRDGDYHNPTVETSTS